MIDTDAEIRKLIAKDSPLTTLVSTRVYCPNLPAGYNTSGAALVYSCRGGSSETYTPLVRASYQFTCWGATLTAARSVYRALHDYLHGAENLVTSSAQLAWALEQVHGQDRIDPDTGWPFILTFYEMTFRI